MTLKFENPPINEIAIVAYFDPPLRQLKSEHIGMFWARIRDDFPVVKQQPSLEVSETFNREEAFPMPNYWFISEDKTSLIQIQKDSITFNWKKNKNEYPHFDKHIKPNFDRYLETLERFVKEDVGTTELKIDLCELIYINIVKKCDYWNGPEDTIEIIPSFSVLDTKSGTDSLQASNSNYLFKLDNNLDLEISIVNGWLQGGSSQPKSPLLMFEIRAGGKSKDSTKLEINKWYQNAHDKIIDCFLDMTSEKARKEYWKQIDNL